MLTGLAQVAVTFHDLPAAIAFYRDTLGLPMLFETNGMAFFQLGGTRLMFTTPEKPEFDHPASVLYFHVKNIDESHAELVRRGVTFEDAPHIVGTMGKTEIWMCFLRDPDGHLVGITEERTAA